MQVGFCVYDLQRMHDEHARGDLGAQVVSSESYMPHAYAHLTQHIYWY